MFPSSSIGNHLTTDTNAPGSTVTTGFVSSFVFFFHFLKTVCKNDCNAIKRQYNFLFSVVYMKTFFTQALKECRSLSPFKLL